MEYKQVTILAIEEVEEEVEVYDIEVEEDNSFVAEGAILHNCLICGPDDGKIFYFSGAVRHPGKEQLPEDRPAPSAPHLPRHPLCRCLYSPLVKSWKDLGLSPDIDPKLKRILDGKPASTETYNQWLKKQSPAFQKNVLGPNRYKLWSEGKLKPAEMVKDNKLISLRKLGVGPAKPGVPVRPGTIRGLTSRLRSTALASEPETTKLLSSLAAQQGAKLEGLPFRVKSSKSTFHKINSELKDNPGWTLGDLEKHDVNDILRYTMLAEERRYTGSVANTLRGLNAKGHRVERIRNYWDSTHYKGINTVMRNPQGIKYELQFHTPKSIYVKEEVSHPLYEKIRSAERLGLSSADVAGLEGEMVKSWTGVEVPMNVMSISQGSLVNILAEPAWTPTMTAGEAEIWAAGSKIKETLYRALPEKYIDQAMKVGFEPAKSNRGALYGRGIYTAFSDEHLWRFGDIAAELRCNVKNPLFIDLVKNPDAYKKILTDYCIDTYGSVEAGVEAAKSGKMMINDIWKRGGWDAVIINDPNPAGGGKQMLIFDPMKIVIVRKYKL